jgi:hypothetical protein
MSDSPTDMRDLPESQANSADPPRSSRNPRTALRYVLPAALFILVVAGIAWVTQFTPNRRSRTQTTNPVAANHEKGAPIVKFTLNIAVWDPDDRDYKLETERGKDSHFDFPFENNSDGPAELGFEERSCDCTSLQVCVVEPAAWARYNEEIQKNPLTANAGDWAWTPLEVRDPKGFIIPARGKGLVRVSWHGRKAPGSHLNLTQKVWHEPQGTLSERHFDSLVVPSVVAAPVLYMPQRVDLGTIVGPRVQVKPAEFTLWSSTRDKLDLLGGDSPDPLFEYQSKRLSAEECRAWETKLRQEGENTRVRCVYHFTVKVLNEAGGKTLYQGPFRHQVQFILDEDKLMGPIVEGAVKAEVMVGNARDRGRVDLQIFRAKEDVTRDFSLWADEKLILEKDSQTPPTLEVVLKKQETAGTQAKWNLQVTVPADTQFGPFPEDSVIILRTKTTPPRFIRIPVIGNGQS